MTRIEELEEKRAKAQEARAKAKDEQYEKDLEARIALEEEHGTIVSVKVSRFSMGQPTEAYLRTPNAAEYKRMKDQVHRASVQKNVKAQADAVELLGRACWVYPAGDEAQAAMLEAFPGFLSSIAVAAVALAEGKEESETGKG